MDISFFSDKLISNNFLELTETTMLATTPLNPAPHPPTLIPLHKLSSQVVCYSKVCFRASVDFECRHAILQHTYLLVPLSLRGDPGLREFEESVTL